MIVVEGVKSNGILVGVITTLVAAGALAPIVAPLRAQTVADSVVLAAVAVAPLTIDGRRHAHWHSTRIGEPVGAGERRWTALIRREVEEQRSDLLRPVADSATAVTLQVVKVDMATETASLRVSWSQCSAIGQAWNRTISYQFARVPGSWVYTGSRDHRWAHGRCARRQARPPVPVLPNAMRRVPPPVILP